MDLAGERAFALGLHRVAAKEEENTCLGAESVWMGLAMLLFGANEPLLATMSRVLGLPVDTTPMGEGASLAERAVARLLAELDQRQDEANALYPSERAEDGGRSLELHAANALWPARGVAIRPDVAATLARAFRAATREVDYADPTAAAATINAWVEGQTSRKIRNLVSARALTPNTPLVLTAATYFKGRWSVPFVADFTRDEPFRLADGSRILVPTMQTTDYFAVHQERGLAAVEIPYIGKKLAMVVVVPDDLRAFEAGLDGATWDRIVRSLRAPARVFVTMPRFHIEQHLELTNDLHAMGLDGIFRPGGLDRMLATHPTTTPSSAPFAVSNVVHGSFLDVDESGTEAAAATAFVATGAAAPVEVATVRVDRPFFYAIHDRPTGTLLYLGRVTHPRTASLS